MYIYIYTCLFCMFHLARTHKHTNKNYVWFLVLSLLRFTTTHLQFLSPSCTKHKYSDFYEHEIQSIQWFTKESSSMSAEYRLHRIALGTYMTNRLHFYLFFLNTFWQMDLRRLIRWFIQFATWTIGCATWKPKNVRKEKSFNDGWSYKISGKGTWKAAMSRKCNTDGDMSFLFENEAFFAFDLLCLFKMYFLADGTFVHFVHF